MTGVQTCVVPIGDELMKLNLLHAQKSKAAHKAVINFTFNPVSQGLYIMHGLYPQIPLYFFGAARERVMAGLPDAPLRSLAITAAHMQRLAEIDAHAIGVTREKHHRYLLDDPATTGVMPCASGECVGYAYIGSNGHVGPLAV